MDPQQTVTWMKVLNMLNKLHSLPSPLEFGNGIKRLHPGRQFPEGRFRNLAYKQTASHSYTPGSRFLTLWKVYTWWLLTPDPNSLYRFQSNLQGNVVQGAACLYGIETYLFSGPHFMLAMLYNGGKTWKPHFIDILIFAFPARKITFNNGKIVVCSRLQQS